MEPIAEVPTGPQTSEQDVGQPGASSSGAVPAMKRDGAGSTVSESADPQTQKGSNLSRSSPSPLGVAGRTSKKQAAMSRASQEGLRREKVSAGSDIGKGGVGQQTPEVVLSEAETSTEWYQAIERKDCKKLMNLLRQEGGSDLLLKTGKAGRTALHVAAIQGSLELVDTIRGLYPSAAITKEFPEQLTRAIDGRCAMAAVDIAFHIVGYFSREQKKINDDFMIEDGTFTPDLELSAQGWLNKYKLTGDIIQSIEQMMTLVWSKGTAVGGHEGLMESFARNVDYNFCDDEIYGHVFLFHHACSRVDGRDFVANVIKHCREDGVVRVIELMQLRDFQGRTPLHVAVAVEPDKGRKQVLENLFRCLGVKEVSQYATNEDIDIFEVLDLYLGVPDGRGWTPLHLAATQPHSDIHTLFGKLRFKNIYYAMRLLDRGIDDSYLDGGGQREYCTVLHLAILHKNAEFIKLLKNKIGFKLPWHHRISRDIYCVHTGRQVPSGKDWSALSLALLLGNEDILDILLSENEFEWLDEKSQGAPYEIPIICLAASLGNIEILRKFLDSDHCDPFESDSLGQTCLHYVANGLIEPCDDDGCAWKTMMKAKLDYPYLCAKDVPNVAWLDGLYELSPQVERVNKGHSGRKGCINMLLQAGVDIWQKDKRGRIANPGRTIIDDGFISWWHEKMAKEALDLRNNLNQGGNAISIIGALIATASYVGPLQPPLSYGSDPSMQLSPTSDNTGYAHVWDPYVKIFMVSNSLSFYLAIASIMLAVVPSLPMPQEALLNELGRTRKTVASAICVLLLSVVGILVSYATASIAVMPNHTNFVNVRWTSYPALVGGFACLIGIVLFLNRVMRLMYPEMCRWFKKVLFKVWKETFGKVLNVTYEKVLDIWYWWRHL